MIKENQKALNTLLAVLDAGILSASLVLAFYIHFRNYSGESYIGIDYYYHLLWIIVPAYFLLYRYFNLHNSFRYKTLFEETGKVIQANFAGGILIFVLLFFLKEVHVSRMVILLFGIFNAGMTSLFRFSLRMVLRRLRARGYNIKHLLLVGWNDVAAEFYDKVSGNRNLGYEFIGYLSRKREAVAGRKIDYAGRLEELPALLDSKGVDEVIISINYDEFPELGKIIEICEKAGVKSNLLPFYTKYLPTKPYIDEIDGMPLINIRKVPLDNFLNAFLKRTFDILSSAFMLILFSPVMLAVAVGVGLTSPGPVIYRQERIGKNRKPFVIYKFRSMRQADGNSDRVVWGTKDDGRRTKFGAFIRKCSLDELPQLWNVLRGDMSLVGPRPERPFFVDQFRETVPLYMIKHLVRPGITGWAQVNGWRGDTSIEERIKCDIYYIEHWTFLFDIKILFLTVLKGVINQSEELPSEPAPGAASHSKSE